MNGASVCLNYSTTLKQIIACPTEHVHPGPCALGGTTQNEVDDSAQELFGEAAV